MFCAYPVLVLAFAPVGGAVHLAGWEKVVAGATSYSCDDLRLVRRHLITKRETTLTGSLFCQKPNLWRLRLSGPDGGTAYLGNGRSVYEYDETAKQVTEFRLADPGETGANQWFIDRLVRSMMSNGIDPQRLLAAATRPGELADRFGVTLQQFDDHYVYLRLAPTRADASATADRVVVVLTRPDSSAGAYLLFHVQIVKSNGQETEDWDLRGATYDPPGLTAKMFEYAPPPADWKVQRPSAP